MNGQPLNLYVESLFVSELSFINRMKEFTQITDTDVLYHYIRIYLSHLMNGVKIKFFENFGSCGTEGKFQHRNLSS